MLAIESPFWNPNAGIGPAFRSIDIVLTIAFTMEMLLKIFVLGFIMNKGAYLRDAWNILDFVIVIVSIISLAAAGVPGLKSLRSLRTLRVLRPLRLVNRYPGLKLVVNALLASGPKILDVLVVCLLFFLIFAIVGINFFKGRLNTCDGDTSGGEGAFLENPDWSAMDEASVISMVTAGSQFAALALGTEDWTTAKHFGAVP